MMVVLLMRMILLCPWHVAAGWLYCAWHAAFLQPIVLWSPDLLLLFSRSCLGAVTRRLILATCLVLLLRCYW